MSPLELLLFGAACYLFGLVSGAVVLPWLVDRGLPRPPARRTSGAATAAAGRASPTASAAPLTTPSGGRQPGAVWPTVFTVGVLTVAWPAR